MRRSVFILCVLTSFVWVKSGNAAVSDKHLEWWVGQRIANLEFRFSQRPFDDIGWAHDIRHSYSLAKKHHRPVFVFTFDGIEMDTGRC